MIFPKVKWASHKFCEKEALESGYTKKLRGSYIKGMCDEDKKTIYLNAHIMKNHRPILNEFECILHELIHFFSPSSVIDRFIDRASIFIQWLRFER